MSFIENLRSQVMDPTTDTERIENITSLLTCGYECGGRNERTIQRFFGVIIDNVCEFLAPMSDEEKENLPDGVMRRLTDARTEAEAYREQLRKQEALLAPQDGCPGKRCEECGICTEPD